MLAEFQPEVAVLDIGLPGLDGYDLARRLRDELGPRTPRLIAVTGYGRDSDRERSRIAGFDVHLVKPVDIDTLIRAVSGVQGEAQGCRAKQ
jgi:CheY-like chemotaxis protein